MLYLQLALLFTLFITTSTAPWPLITDNDKMCINITSAPGDNARCAIYCRMRGSSGGSCQKKRCVCANDKGKGNDSNEQRSLKPSPFLVKSKSIVTCKAGSMKCHQNCKSAGKLNGSCINEVCVCSEL